MWLLASVVIAGAVLFAAGQRGAINTVGEQATAGMEAQELIALVESQQESQESWSEVESLGYSEVTRSALAQISYPWQELLPDWNIEFYPERQDLYGLTIVSERRIEIYVRGDQSSGLLAHVIAHELGHAIDVTLNSEADRQQWRDLRGLEASWFPSDGETDFSHGAGDFAESFAAWQVGPQSFRSNLGPPPNDDAIRLMAKLSAG